ncbi:hypothetical protein [Massilia sp. S19_KUP03_FR1]|uniref:hypothetical protein n=1 Tax=Massilia sp. S19_KUP03_FR1 TaxID=3025503 RepID=UPI002FCD47EA
MLNKYVAALAATVVFGILFPLSFCVLTQQNLHPIAVAVCAAVFFFSALALCARFQRKQRHHQG